MNLDDIPFEPDDSAEHRVVVLEREPRKCKRHRWSRDTQITETRAGLPYAATAVIRCSRCPAIRDEAVSRRGKNSRARGNSQEREWCKRLGFRRTGQYGGPDDGIAVNGMFVGQAKSMATARFPGWMATELDKLPRAGGRIPVLGLLETPGPGNRPRRLLVMDEADWIALHGGSNQ